MKDRIVRALRFGLICGLFCTGFILMFGMENIVWIVAGMTGMMAAVTIDQREERRKGW